MYEGNPVDRVDFSRDYQAWIGALDYSVMGARQHVSPLPLLPQLKYDPGLGLSQDMDKLEQMTPDFYKTSTKDKLENKIYVTPSKLQIN